MLGRERGGVLATGRPVRVEEAPPERRSNWRIAKDRVEQALVTEPRVLEESDQVGVFVDEGEDVPAGFAGEGPPRRSTVRRERPEGLPPVPAEEPAFRRERARPSSQREARHEPGRVVEPRSVASRVEPLDSSER